MPELISLIVTTYERPDALDAVLRSIARQSDRDFEVIIADDGSGPDTLALIERWKRNLGAPLIHVWQEHRDFRAAEMRNRAILASRGDYCVFLDGDCLVRPDFIAAHRSLAEYGWFVTGNRALLSPEFTAAVLEEVLEPETWPLSSLAAQRLSGGINRLKPVMPLPLGPLRKLRATAWEGARSCNLAVWRRDLDCVDGFDAAFSGWGLEDSDLLVRLIHAGVRRKDGAFATGVLHLWHPPSDRSQFADNRARLDAVIASGRVRAQCGVSSLNGQGRPAVMAGPL